MSTNVRFQKPELSLNYLMFFVLTRPYLVSIVQGTLLRNASKDMLHFVACFFEKKVDDAVYAAHLRQISRKHCTMICFINRIYLWRVLDEMSRRENLTKALQSEDASPARIA